jgi:Ca2+-binding RTX toxin-like protein
LALARASQELETPCAGAQRQVASTYGETAMNQLPTIKYHYGDPVAGYPTGVVYNALYGDLESASATSVVFKGDGDYRVVFHGDFILDNGVVVGGTMTGFSAFAGPTELITGSDFQIAATELLDAIEVFDNDSEPFWNLTFGGQVTHRGSAMDDYFYDQGGKILAGAGNDSVYGSAANDIIKGGLGNDLMGGSQGADKVFGGAGRDTFLLIEESDVDRIMDFDVGKDMIALVENDFGALGLGFVEKHEFAIGKGTTAHHHLIYDPGNGALYYDEDGNGGADPEQIAQLSVGLKLKASHFYLYDD